MDTEMMVDSAPSDSEAGRGYAWFLSDGSSWQQIANDHIIETHYCQPGARQMAINTATYGRVLIDFDNLQTVDSSVKVLRWGPIKDVGWYYKDDQLWHEYGSQGSGMNVSPISSRDVEQNFLLNPRGSFTFTVAPWSYRLDFTTMTQTNCVTGVSRKVRRRPKLTQSPVPAAVPAAVPPINPPAPPTTSGVKWEFMGEEGTWTEYQADKCSYDSAAIERDYQLKVKKVNFRVHPYSYTLNFGDMCQRNDLLGTRRAVRRRTDDWTQQSSSIGAQPRWQFLDVDRKWKDYSKGFGTCSVSSQDIELEYQRNPSGTMTFSTLSHQYELSFSAMTQRNLQTNTTRHIQRLQQ